MDAEIVTASLGEKEIEVSVDGTWIGRRFSMGDGAE
jgi:hypothetical protein